MAHMTWHSKRSSDTNAATLQRGGIDKYYWIVRVKRAVCAGRQ